MIVYQLKDRRQETPFRSAPREAGRNLAAARRLGVRPAYLPTPTSSPLVFENIDRKANRARFYSLSVEPTLFGDMAVIRHWGRVGTRGRHRIDIYSSLNEAWHALDRLARIKRRRGYCEAAMPEEAARTW